MNPGKSATINRFFYFIGCCAIAIYCLVIYQHAYNIPKWDDFPEILQFLDRWLAARSPAEKFSVFISQTNEHILLVNHFIILCQYYSIGQLNFSWLIYIGNVFYIGSALVLWYFFCGQSYRAFGFAITMLAGLTFYPYDSTLWAMTAISNQAVIFFSFLAIYAAAKQNHNLSLAMLLSVLAVFSQSNGLIVLFIIALHFFTTKKSQELKYWLVFSIIITCLYAYWFNPASVDDQSLLSILHQLPPQNYVLTAPAFLAYFGGSIFSKATPVSFLMALIIGTAITSIVFFQFRRNLYPTPVLLVIGFLLLSILSIATYRGLFIGPGVVFVSRYKMYGAYFLIIGILLSPLIILKLQESPVWQTGIMSIAALYFSWAFIANLPQAKMIDGDLFKSLQHWVEDGDFRRAKGFFIRDADAYLFAALKNKTYNPITLIPDKQLIHHVEKINVCPYLDKQIAAVSTDFSISHKNPNAAAIKLNALTSDGKPLQVKLCSPAQSYQFEIAAGTSNIQPSIYFIDRDHIAPGTYDVWLNKDEKIYRLENPFLNKAATR